MPNLLSELGKADIVLGLFPHEGELRILKHASPSRTGFVTYHHAHKMLASYEAIGEPNEEENTRTVARLLPAQHQWLRDLLAGNSAPEAQLILRELDIEVSERWSAVLRTIYAHEDPSVVLLPGLQFIVDDQPVRLMDAGKAAAWVWHKTGPASSRGTTQLIERILAGRVDIRDATTRAVLRQMPTVARGDTELYSEIIDNKPLWGWREFGGGNNDVEATFQDPLDAALDACEDFYNL